jgi:PASTA domain
VKTIGGSVRTVAMGKLELTDRRSFQVAAVDEAGNVGAKTGALKVVPKLAKLKLAAAKAALKKRGFKAGKVTYKASSSVPKGRVIRGSASGLRPAGSKIGLTVSRGRSAAHRPVTSAAAPPPPSTLGTGSAATPPPPSGTPAPAPAAVTPLVPAPATAVDEPLVQPERGRVLPLVGTRADDLSGLRRELGFGLLAAAFSIAVVAVLRARRPAVTDEEADGEQLLLWDQRIVEAIRRFLRLG